MYIIKEIQIGIMVSNNVNFLQKAQNYFCRSFHFQSSNFSQKSILSRRVCFSFADDFKKNVQKDRIGENIPQKNRIISADVMKFQNLFSKKRKRPDVSALHYKGEILYGVHPVYLALLKRKRDFFCLFVKNCPDVSLHEKNSKMKEILNLANEYKLKISAIDSRSMNCLAPGAVHQGVCLDAGNLPTLDWHEDEKREEKHKFQKLPLWLILDEILDPMNVGAIIRSAYYFGVNKIFVLKEKSCKLSPTVSKASSGALEVVDVYRIGNIQDFLHAKKADGWHVLSTVAYCENENTTVGATVGVDDLAITKPTILILGNEGSGVSHEVQRFCDNFISIPPSTELSTNINSLNVSVAAGIILNGLSQSIK